MTIPNTRPAPPPLEYRAPDCALCGNEVVHDGDGFCCEQCCAWWDSHGDGQWDDPDAEQCGATVQPLADMVDEEARTRTYRCALEVGHGGLHASVDYTYCTKGWA